jgi:hypothetical protein
MNKQSLLCHLRSCMTRGQSSLASTSDTPPPCYLIFSHSGPFFHLRMLLVLLFSQAPSLSLCPCQHYNTLESSMPVLTQNQILPQLFSLIVAYHFHLYNLLHLRIEIPLVSCLVNACLFSRHSNVHFIYKVDILLVTDSKIVC